MVVFSGVPDREHKMCQINMEGALEHCGAFIVEASQLCDSPRWRN